MPGTIAHGKVAKRSCEEIPNNMMVYVFVIRKPPITWLILKDAKNSQIGKTGGCVIQMISKCHPFSNRIIEIKNWLHTGL